MSADKYHDTPRPGGQPKAEGVDPVAADLAGRTLDLVMSVLANAGDAPEMKRVLARELRKLAAARTVVLAGVAHERGGVPSLEILATSPDGRSEDPEFVTARLDDATRLESSRLFGTDPGGPPRDDGIASQPFLVMPLRNGKRLVGAVLALGLSDPAATEAILDGRDTLANVAAVTLDNILLLEREALSFRNMEREVMERIKTERVLERERARLSAIIEGTGAGTWEWDIASDRVASNEKTAGFLGLAPRDTVDYTMSDWLRLMHVDDRTPAKRAMLAHLRDETDRFEREARFRHRDGGWVWIATRGTVSARGPNGEPVAVSGTQLDVTARKRAEEEILRLATHDPLTGLPARRLAYDRMDKAMRTADRHGGKSAVIYVDLDGFKSVNDAIGHAGGDELLKLVAARLLSCVRGTDTVARLGGDEFLVVTTELDDAAAAEPIVGKIIRRLSEPFAIPRCAVSGACPDGAAVEAIIGASAGIALYPDDGDAPDGLLKRADEAMYRVKRTGKNGYAFASRPQAR